MDEYVTSLFQVGQKIKNRKTNEAGRIVEVLCRDRRNISYRVQVSFDELEPNVMGTKALDEWDEAAVGLLGS
jgi:hypothetical protein